MLFRVVVRQNFPFVNLSVIRSICCRHYSTETKPVVYEKQCSPVMVNQVLEYLNPQNDELFVDMTFGSGGHTRALLNTNSSLKIIALDRDPTSHECACKLSEEYPGRITPVLGRFSDLPTLLKELKIGHNCIDGMLFDVGCSSQQLATPSRGFSVHSDGPLDMRMDQNRIPDQLTAKDILHKASEDDIARIFKVYGEEKKYKKIAEAVVNFRYMSGRLETTHQLASLIESVFDVNEDRIDTTNRLSHPASKVFRALRRFVNNELNEVNYGMLVAHRYLKVGGRLVTIAYSTLEDTVVKRHISGNMFNSVASKVPLKYVSHSLVYNEEDVFKMMEHNWQSLTQHIVVPSLAEVEENPFSGSAALRAAVKIK